jgi:hypothetical protein
MMAGVDRPPLELGALLGSARLVSHRIGSPLRPPTTYHRRS